MIMKNSLFTTFVYSTLILLLLVSCDTEQQQTYDTPVSGTDTIYVEDVLYPYFISAKHVYDSVFQNAHITLIPVNARRGMSLLFSDSTNCVILSRDYLHDEDSIVKAMQLPFRQIEIAKDGLVFFAHKSWQFDTLNITQLTSFISGNSNVSNQFFDKFEHKLIIPSMQSSEYAGLLHYFSNNKASVSINTIVIEDRDSLEKYVIDNNVVGLGMMSRILKDSSLKPIRIGYVDSTGKRIPPQIVHPGFIVQNMYPFIVPIFAYMKSEKQNLAWGFATFMEKDPTVQNILLKEGIVPSHAKYNLIRED